MAQNKKPKQGKRAPAYSADGMVVSLIVGLILIALGVLILLSNVLSPEIGQAEIFALLRTLSSGLAGSLAIALPIVPVWGGVLIIMSTQRKAPKREFILGCVLLLLILTTVTLFTFMSSGSSLMEAILSDVRQDHVGEGMSSFLSDAFEYGSGSKRNDGLAIGGGFLGMLLAWPLWKGFGVIGGGVFTILLALVVFCFLIRLDVKGISAALQQKHADARIRREEELLRQHEQELIWQQEQAARQEQIRIQQEQMRQQQIQRMQQSPPPQPQPQPEPLDPWSSMMPAGTANWNQTQGRMQPVQPMQGPQGSQGSHPSQPSQPSQGPRGSQPPLVQKVEPRPQKAQKSRKKPQVGFEPTPEEMGQYSPPQSMPEVQTDAPRRKSLFRREEPEAAGEKPRRKGIFDRPAQDEPLPGEATQPTRREPQRAAAPARPVRQQEPAPVQPVIAQPVPEEDDWYTKDTPPVQEAPSDWDAPAQPEPPVRAEQPAAPAPAGRSPFQKPAQAPAAQPDDPLDAQTPVREGSFMARLRAAKAAAEGQQAPAAAEAAPAPAQPRKSRKDTPSAWSQPDAEAGSASWRPEGGAARPARPVARSAAQPAPKPQPAWEDTPPWEDFPGNEEPQQPAAPVTPVLSRETPQDSMWQPEIKTPPRRSMASMPDGALMETEEERPYVFPTMDLLKAPEPQRGISEEEDALRSRRLENTLQSFRVPAKVRHITHGPAISRFELELAPGVKVSKVTDLNRNIAMNMEVKSVRIEAPIPGKSLVGVEVPNRERATVTLREVLESEPMRKATKPLVVALGKDIAGTPIVCDLAKMPHLLIAGATGSGKSVCINTIINSLLYRCSPKEVRLILVDPKVVELQCYNGIPHLLVPVVSDPHKASGALAWAVGEMMDRYKRFQEAGVRAIDGYNEQMPEDEKMPRIVIVIDELADLMMTCKKDVEERICRLAQLARAAGIHLIVATQRPSVDVITGLIKANIPSRIAFKVSSNVDSRTILDRIGAEQLLGYGDMLYMPTGEFTPIRVQGCFLSDPEVNRITDFIRETCPASYDPVVLEELEKLQSDSDTVVIPDSSSGDDYTGGDGSLLAQCIEMAVNDGQVSTSLIQRRLKLGYARAGRLVDEMEKRGIVSQKDGAKPRMCLISREEFEMMKDSGQLD